MSLHELHDRAATAGSQNMSCTCGELSDLAEATKDLLTGQPDDTLDAHVAATNAGRNPRHLGCRLRASSVLRLTALLTPPNLSAITPPTTTTTAEDQQHLEELRSASIVLLRFLPHPRWDRGSPAHIAYLRFRHALEGRR